MVNSSIGGVRERSILRVSAEGVQGGGPAAFWPYFGLVCFVLGSLFVRGATVKQEGRIKRKAPSTGTKYEAWNLAAAVVSNVVE